MADPHLIAQGFKKKSKELSDVVFSQLLLIGRFSSPLNQSLYTVLYCSEYPIEGQIMDEVHIEKFLAGYSNKFVVYEKNGKKYKYWIYKLKLGDGGQNDK